MGHGAWGRGEKLISPAPHLPCSPSPQSPEAQIFPLFPCTLFADLVWDWVKRSQFCTIKNSKLLFAITASPKRMLDGEAVIAKSSLLFFAITASPKRMLDGDRFFTLELIRVMA
ncbi:hypothetical protein VF08_09710 [Nostoc linckia z8]|uniref:Uncharacterized protein n=1 Tax=Nostoc linckia z8 TaxID=1628746 RepID=A0A9Q5ZDT4_NOSLI|nr:hypothetical protein VF08_09710 [Nostoc linckia z8]